MHLIDFIFPKFCVGCGRMGRYFCSSCVKRIIPIDISEMICSVCGKSAIDGKTHPRCRTRYTLDGLLSFFHYNGPIQSAIKQMKYQFVSDITTQCISLSLQSVNLRKRYPWVLHNATIIPIPLHAQRQRFRGFNQASLLVKELAKEYTLPFRDDVIRRVRMTTPQVEMKSRSDRMKNMSGVFVVNSRMIESIPKKIVLVDDVYTTGATMKEAAFVLKQAGVGEVWAITLAR